MKMIQDFTRVKKEKQTKKKFLNINNILSAFLDVLIPTLNH